MKDDYISVASTYADAINWEEYLSDGVIVELQIKRYRGVTTVDFADLGIDNSIRKSMGKYITPGQKKLFPVELDNQLRSIETSARTNLKVNSFPCDIFSSQGKFVPASAYMAFKAKNDSLQKNFYEVRDMISQNFDKVIDKVLSDYRVLAERIYQKKFPNAESVDEDFIGTLVETMTAQMPSKELILSSFEYNTYLREIPEEIRMKVVPDRRVKTLPSTMPPSIRLWENKDSDTEDIAKAREQIRKDIDKSNKNRVSDMTKMFLNDVVVSLRERASVDTKRVIESIDKNGRLLGRPSINIRSMVSALRSLDFYGDYELQEYVDWVEYELDGRAIRSDENIRKALAAMNEWAGKSILYLRHQSDKKPKRANEYIDLETIGIAGRSLVTQRQKHMSSMQGDNTSKAGIRRKNFLTNDVENQDKVDSGSEKVEENATASEEPTQEHIADAKEESPRGNATAGNGKSIRNGVTSSASKGMNLEDLVNDIETSKKREKDALAEKQALVEKMKEDEKNRKRNRKPPKQIITSRKSTKADNQPDTPKGLSNNAAVRSDGKKISIPKGFSSSRTNRQQKS